MQSRQIIPFDELLDDIVRIASEIHRDIGACCRYGVYRRAMVLLLEEEGYEVETDLDYEVEYRGESIGSGVITFRVDGEAFVEIQGADTDARQQRGRLAGACHGNEESRGVLLNFDRSFFHADVEGDLDVVVN